MSELTFHDDPDQRTVELRVDGAVASLITYSREDGLLALTHTETAPDFGGRGYASRLVEHVVDGAEADGESVMPVCSFVADWFAKHPERIELVPEAFRGSLDATA